MISLAQFAKNIAESVVECHPRLEVGLSKVGGLAQSLAAEYIGHEMPGWPPLKQSTIEDKERRGFDVPAPLLRTGKMRDSIHFEVEPFALELTLGSTSPIAHYQEMGTEHIQARPFLMAGVSNSMPYAADVFAKIAVSLLTGKK